MLSLEVKEQVLQQSLILHEKVQGLGQTLDLHVILLRKVQLRLNGEDLLILVQDLLEDLQVLKLDFGWSIVTLLLIFVRASQALQLIRVALILV